MGLSMFFPPEGQAEYVHHVYWKKNTKPKFQTTWGENRRPKRDVSFGTCLFRYRWYLCVVAGMGRVGEE